MSLPAGFKVNGMRLPKGKKAPTPPRVQKIISLLEKLPTGDLWTTRELMDRTGLSFSGGAIQSSALNEYREKVDNKLFWGSRKSIAQLRKQLVEPVEDAHDES